MVHCFAGKSRATSFTLAYLVGKKGITLKEGLETIRAVRPIVQPNIGFFMQLKIFEKKCKHSLYPISCVSDEGFGALKAALLEAVLQVRAEAVVEEA